MRFPQVTPYPHISICLNTYAPGVPATLCLLNQCQLLLGGPNLGHSSAHWCTLLYNTGRLTRGPGIDTAVSQGAGGHCDRSKDRLWHCTGLHPTMLAARVATGSALADCRGALPALKSHLALSRTASSATADSQRPGDAVTVLLAACTHSPACCKAAANADLPQV